jgi:hypothetical protein
MRRPPIDQLPGDEKMVPVVKVFNYPLDAISKVEGPAEMMSMGDLRRDAAEAAWRKQSWWTQFKFKVAYWWRNRA